MYEWMYTSLVPEQLDKSNSCSTFTGLSDIGQSILHPNILVPKTGAFQMGPKTQNGHILENDCNNSD
jgi:hypothetical protein